MIKKGLQLQITSWECDSDNYNTKILSGLCEDEVRFYIEFVKLFKSKNDRSDTTCYGNTPTTNDDYTDWETLIGRVKVITDKHHSGFVIIQDVYDTINTDEDYRGFIFDLTYELLGCSEYYLFRVFDSFKVFFYPEDVKEVTSEYND